MTESKLLDRWGTPVKRNELTEEIAVPTSYGIRTPLHHAFTDGLDPQKLARILREADQGDPVAYLEMAEIIEERDLHYVGVLGTRKRSVTQLDITINAASDEPFDVKVADGIRDWLKRDELQEELFDILDALGKGYSFTEIIWERTDDFWHPAKLERRDPRWFRFDRRDLSTPLLLLENGQEVPLPAFRFIYAEMKAKSGIALRGGLARTAAWAWMFKSFTLRDWAMFTQAYGRPIRIGRYHSGASEEDKKVLLQGLRQLAGDFSAMMPETTMLEIIESKNLGTTSKLYEERADWLDRQMSKAIIGQTATTDAVTGGLGSGKEHRQVQEDIERADAAALAAILNRDLIRPWVQLNYSKQVRYPRLAIARPDVEDVTKLATAVSIIVKTGLQVSKSQIRARMGLEEPKDADDVLGFTPANSAPIAPPAAHAGQPQNLGSKINTVLAEINKGLDVSGADVALQSERASTGLISGGVDLGADPLDPLVTRMTDDIDPNLVEIFDVVDTILNATSDLAEAREMIRQAFPSMSTEHLSQILGRGLVAAGAGGFIEGYDADV